MTVLDAAKWQEWSDNNKDGDGATCVSYAERWARVMEEMIASGATLVGCAKEASHLADTEGITGFTYVCAVVMLVQCWKFGEELRRWYKETHSATNETGGVLNPALLSVTRTRSGE